MNENETLIERTVSNLKDLVEADTVIGKSIFTENGVIIPVSRVTVGIVSGQGSGEKSRKGLSSAGGGGAGGSVSPIGFLVISSGVAKFINVEKEDQNKWGNLISSALDLVKPAK